MDKTPPTVSFRGRRNSFEKSKLSWEQQVKSALTTLECPFGASDSKLAALRSSLAELVADAPTTGWAKALVERAQKVLA